MTLIISALGMAGRFAGDLLSSALGWASNLLFGRVPREHQRFVVLMMAGSVMWLILLLGLLIPTVAGFYLAATPHPPFVDDRLVGTVLLGGVIALPLAVGVAGFLVPAGGPKPDPAALIREMLRGYVLTPVLVGLLVFLAGVGVARKARSRRHGWSDEHVAIVSEPGPQAYDELVVDLVEGLARAGLDVRAQEAPRILNAPGWLLTRIAGEHVRRLRPERLLELAGRNLRVGVYPSDIAISGTTAIRVRARAAIVARLVTSRAHLTRSAEAQRVEDDLRSLAQRRSRAAELRTRASLGRAFDAIDEQLLDIDVPTDEWDLLYRLRLQAERDLLIGAEAGMAFPGADRAAGESRAEALAAVAAESVVAATSERAPGGPVRRRRTSPDPSR